MEKVLWKPGTMVYPLPAVLVTCGSVPEEWNIITIAWTGTICSDPSMCYISVRKERHSYNLIKNSMEFVINLTTEKLAYATDWCGIKSGKDFNKFKEMNLTPMAASQVKSPLIKESPINIECSVKQIIPLGSHDMFISEVVAVNASKEFLNDNTGEFDLIKSMPLVFSHGKYYKVGELIGKFGFSVKKDKNKKS